MLQTFSSYVSYHEESSPRLEYQSSLQYLARSSSAEMLGNKTTKDVSYATIDSRNRALNAQNLLLLRELYIGVPEPGEALPRGCFFVVQSHFEGGSIPAPGA
jgi:hypothetical protein